MQGGGRLDVYKGGSGALLYSCHGAWQTRSFGWARAVLGDVDLDAVSDFAVSAPTAGSLTGPNPLPGHVLVFSGATGTPLWTKVGAAGQRMGFWMWGLEEVDGDGACEMAVSDGESDLHLVSADTGSIDMTWPGLGVSIVGVAGPGDLTGDGVADFIIRPFPTSIRTASGTMHWWNSFRRKRRRGSTRAVATGWTRSGTGVRARAGKRQSFWCWVRATCART